MTSVRPRPPRREASETKRHARPGTKRHLALFADSTAKLATLDAGESGSATSGRQTARHAEQRLAEPNFPTAPTSRLSWWRWRASAILVALDMYSVVLAWLLVPVGRAAVTPVAVIAVALLVAQRMDIHRPRLELSLLDDVPAYLLIGVVSFATAIATTAAESGDEAFGQCLVFALVAVCFLVAFRAVAYAIARTMRRSRAVAHPVVVIGAGEIGDRLASAMLAHPEYGLSPIGFIDANPAVPAGRLPLPVFGGLEALPQAMRAHDVHDVVFAFSAAPDAEMVRIVRACVRLDCQVFVVPRFFELLGSDRRGRVEVIWGVPLVRLRRWPLRPSGILLKRATDVALAAIALAGLSPLLALVALAVRIEGGRGVIFRQTRVGRDDTPFTLYKFRSMRALDENEQQTHWSIAGDRRVGPVGRFLRRTGLDELPQLVNILRGDMSIVGPRPERPHFVETFEQDVRHYGDRHRVASGLTGLAQVNGLRGDTSIDDRVSFDNYYIDNWSFWADVKIMLRTATTFFRRDDAPATRADAAAADAELTLATSANRKS